MSSPRSFDDRDGMGVYWFALVVFGVPMLGCLALGYFLGSILVGLLLCMVAFTLVLAVMISRVDGRSMARRLVQRAEDHARRGERFAAASLYNNAADILQGLRDLDANERATIDRWRARARSLRG